MYFSSSPYCFLKNAILISYGYQVYIVVDINMYPYTLLIDLLFHSFSSLCLSCNLSQAQNHNTSSIDFSRKFLFLNITRISFIFINFIKKFLLSSKFDTILVIVYQLTKHAIFIPIHIITIFTELTCHIQNFKTCLRHV